MSNLDKIEGIGPAYMAKLKEAGINSTEQLLEKGANPAGRKELETATGISHSLILRWLNNADLFRIKGIGSEYADLLEAAGVNTVPELAQRSAENLTTKMAEINEVKKLVRKVPTASQVTDWVAQAKALPRVLTY